MLDFLRKRAERKERNYRAARRMLLDHGDDALRILADRIEHCDGRDRAHWKRVERLARQMVDEG